MSGVDANVTFKDTLPIGLPQPLSVALSPLSVAITQLPKVLAGLDPLTVNPLTVNPLSVAITQLPKINVGLDPLTIEPLTVTLKPIDLAIRLTELPSIRVHIPAHFRLGLSVLGKEVIGARVQGEAQVITEPYKAGPCEHCGTGP